ncbi:hypothetical protein SASPL_134626 [Salvia splendens]|uniref:HMA domain-containing protein n=1 Tax=Salvia splendens TaxID=180675 RepID=A0A8X8ZF74_SALSN|nr:hypothetical protein SASPL_134626 [Salvia splendens]
MGVEGTFDYIADLISSRKRKKRKQLNTVDLKVRMDCEGCGERVKNVLSGMKGAKSVKVDWKQQKAIVYGFVDAKKVLKKQSRWGRSVSRGHMFRTDSLLILMLVASTIRRPRPITCVEPMSPGRHPQPGRGEVRSHV